MNDFADIITKNDKMLSVLNVAKKIASSDISILILGEDGVGKKLLAQAIHNNSLRKNKQFISVKCSSIPPSLIEHEFFGVSKNLSHKKQKSNISFFEKANNGTLFLNDISSLNLDIQAKIVQIMDSKKIMNLNQEKHAQANIRYISAAKNDLINKVENNEFRMDFYYRIKEMSLNIPPLRERKDDIPLLVNYYLNKFSKDFGKKINSVSDVAMNFLINHDWKGNVRELRNVIRTATALCEQNSIWIEHIPIRMELNKDSDSETNLMSLESFSLKDAERAHIVKILKHCKWNKSKTANLLKISRPRLDRKIEEYNIQKPDKVIKRKK